MKAAALLLAALLAGCSMGAMDPESDADVGNGVRVTPQPGFAQIHLATIRYWTRHGTGLDRLDFYTGIKNGEPLFPVSGMTKKNLPAFQARMTANDVEDLTTQSLTAKGLGHVRASGLRPCRFGLATGFCFDLALSNDEGLEMEGKAIARMENGVLDLLLFTAPSEFYFSDVSPAVDLMFESIKVN